ncbi:MAG: MaoC family dehydratase N-terminal domain-containing protein [Acidimicrobiia bacterium]
MALTELEGQPAGSQVVTIERGPVRIFADALGDRNPAWREEHALVPPTFPFVMPFWGSMGTGGAAGLPIEKLRGPGRMILHGEQEFEYFAWPKVGDTLEGTSTIADVYERERSNGGKMEFYVLETDWKHAGSGELAVRTRFVLIVTVRPPER